MTNRESEVATEDPKPYMGILLEGWAPTRSTYCDAHTCYTTEGLQFHGVYQLCPAHAAQLTPETVLPVGPGEPTIDKPFAYHVPSPAGLDAITELRTLFTYVQRRIDALCPQSRERSVASTNLETTAMWAIKAVVLNDPTSTVKG